ncbi:hypothetical protein QR680_009130 [Steinernema hermaphroditum]|uniref:Uncharacterized protein n=1 Tax=Steinernema hermaphroditum TaxID=289476 RepID=A0AA39M8V6_9BILA|nr:hypothetical protein QR680_009130 [Steinernema hermaphroditum]
MGTHEFEGELLGDGGKGAAAIEGARALGAVETIATVAGGEACALSEGRVEGCGGGADGELLEEEAVGVAILKGTTGGSGGRRTTHEGESPCGGRVVVGSYLTDTVDLLVAL